jgi:uncharacterized membrane protein YfcA
VVGVVCLRFQAVYQVLLLTSRSAVLPGLWLVCCLSGLMCCLFGVFAGFVAGCFGVGATGFVPGVRLLYF